MPRSRVKFETSTLLSSWSPSGEPNANQSANPQFLASPSPVKSSGAISYHKVNVGLYFVQFHDVNKTEHRSNGTLLKLFLGGGPVRIQGVY